MATSLQEITQILCLIPTLDRPKLALLPPKLADYANLFDNNKTGGFAPHRGKFNHYFYLKKKGNGRNLKLLWELLYSTLSDQLLELC